jgi:hypothetical protein
VESGFRDNPMLEQGDGSPPCIRQDAWRSRGIELSPWSGVDREVTLQGLRPSRGCPVAAKGDWPIALGTGRVADAI